MGEVREYEWEKLIMGILYCEPDLAEEVEKRLEALFGKIDKRSAGYDFSQISKYYDAEMKGTTYKYLISFGQLVDPSGLAEIKLMTNNIEREYSLHGQRRINLDPGLLGHGRLVLATTKNAAHRIPLGDGIYAELTLFYARKEWHCFPWTYRDFKLKETQCFLSEVRSIYLRQRKDMYKLK